MKIIDWTLDAGYGVKHGGQFEIEDDATEDEIRAACEEEAWNHLDLWWEVE